MKNKIVHMHLFDFKCNQIVFITVSMAHENIPRNEIKHSWHLQFTLFYYELIDVTTLNRIIHTYIELVLVCLSLCSSFYSSMNFKLEFIAHFFTFTYEIMNIK